MDLPSPTPTDAAEAVFADFLERVEADENPDFAAFCREHQALAPALQRLHVRWQAMTRAFVELSQQPAGGNPSTPSPTLDALMTRLTGGGARIHRYAIGPELARGAMGRIVQAWDEELRREVALKIHRGPDNARQHRRFLEEAQIAAQLDHPGVVPIHELGIDTDGRPYFSMRLVRGRELGELIALAQVDAEGWTRTRVLHVLLRVCEAMAFAHDKGVVHRDLKPGNIMVGRFGETYVMDWGLAHVRGADARADERHDLDTLRGQIAEEDDVSPLLTRHGDVLGTPAYMAPEQAHGTPAAAAPAVDVYATGAILYHLLTGHMPYAAHGKRGGDHILRAVRIGPPARLPDDVPPELRAICERAMAREAADRYASMVALGDDLRAFLEVRTVSAYATGRFAELRKWIARNRGLAASCLVLLLALTGGSIAVTAAWVQADHDRRRADASAQQLLTELDRSAFRSARQSLQLENSSEAAEVLWRTHFVGRMPRATSWALRELAERDPYLVTLPSADVRPVAFARAVDVVLVGGSDGRLQLRDPATLALQAELGDAGPSLMSLAVPDDATWAVTGSSKGDVCVFDLVERRLLRRSTPHTGSVRYLVATGGSGFASGSADGRVLWWQQRDAEPRCLLTHEEGITALAARPGGDGVVAGDERGTLSGGAFDGSWRVERRFGDARLTALAFGDTADELWVGATDHVLRFLDLADPARDRTLPTRNGTCRQLARDRDGSLLVGGWWRTDRLLTDGITFVPVALRGISRFALDKDRRRLLANGYSSGLGLVDLDAGDRRTLPGAGALALSADGARVATIEGNRVVVRDVDRGDVVGTLPPGRTGWLRLDRTGSHVAIATRQPAMVQVFAVATGTLVSSGDGPPDVLFGDACSFSPAGDELATCSGEAVRRTRVADGQVIAEYQLPGARWIRTAWSDDGRWLAAIQRPDTTVRVHDLRDGTWRNEVFTPVLPDGSPTTLSAVALSPDGSRIAVGTWQGGILVRAADGSTITIPGHAGTVWSLQFAASDPGLLFSSGGSQGITAWDLDSIECCYQVLHDVATSMQVSRDGRTLACLLPTGGLVLDLTYRERHIAGNLSYHLDRLRPKVEIDPARERELNAWASEVLARPWPRWR